MQIDKDQIFEILKSRGEHDKATRAQADLPAKVDPQKEQGLLDKLGIDPARPCGQTTGWQAARWPRGLMLTACRSDFPS